MHSTLRRLATPLMGAGLLFAAPLASASPRLLAPAFAEDPPERRPTHEVEPHVVHRSESNGGLRYTWCIPEGYDGETPRQLTVICHGTGLDYRWGHWNNKPGILRPDDIVVSVDGPTPNGKTRLFTDKKKDVEAFHEFLLELREHFAVDGIFLYGHSQGGFFVVHYAGEHPKDVQGVVAHASGAWNWSKTPKDLRRVAIGFMHGTKDPVVPYRQSPGSAAAYRDAKLPLVHLRRLQSYNHWPNAVRATEVLDWCEGMTTEDPERVLELGRRILAPKPADEYQWRTTPGFSAGHEVLSRLTGDGPHALDDVDDKLSKRAKKWLALVDAEGKQHAKALRKAVPSKEKLVLSKRMDWLGHLISVREDFRGVPSVEAYVDAIGYDDLVKSQAKRVRKVLDACYDKDRKKSFETILDELPKAFLFEGYPHDFAKKVEGLEAQSRQLKVSKKSLKNLPLFEAWRDGWKSGFEAYADQWKDWEGVGR